MSGNGRSCPCRDPLPPAGGEGRPAGVPVGEFTHLWPPLLLVLFFLGFSLGQEPLELAIGQWRALMVSPSLVGTDALAAARPAGAFLNAALLGAVGLVIMRLLRPGKPGYEVLCLFLWIGFGLAGKNTFNVWPPFLGVVLYARVAGRPLRELVAPLFLGTTLAPIVSQYAFGVGLGGPGLALGIGLGLGSGFLVAALAGHVYTLHLGYNLYNVGTAAGFIGIVCAMTMRGFGLENQPVTAWSTAWTVPLTWLMGTFFLFLFLLGLLEGGAWRGWRRILACCGRLPSDFIALAGWGGTLVNMGVLGLLGLAYVRMVGGAVNGPVIAGLLALSGFGTLGKHPGNCLPIMAGVFVICLPKIWSPADPGPLLAALMCTTLAPFCGRFGAVAGFVAGALHLPMAMHVGQIHGFLNLYNNGFAGGLTMLVIVGVLKGLRPDLLEEPVLVRPRPPNAPLSAAPSR
ncbi:MAG: DUF1576 domain-containing protein [Candidatus Riflebacteria bacterium]|nr:DUF1576 domain-containing protein [Candidatus Riflebacteria bacterium]